MKNRIYVAIGVLGILSLVHFAAEGADLPRESYTASVEEARDTADVLLILTDSGSKRAIRLFGVAAPMPDQPFARQARNHIVKHFKNTIVSVEVVSTDESGLPVAWVRRDEGLSLNEMLIEEGLGWWDEVNAPDAKRLKKLMVSALVAGKGLWHDSAPLAPWDYRTSHNIKQVSYEIEPAEVDFPENEAPVPDTPTLVAKGSAKPLSSIPIPQDYLGLVGKHQPRIARDAQGNPLGLTASDIGSIPGASQIGFQNGDVVSSVNGINITSEAQIMGLVGQLRGAKSINLQVIRNGKRVIIAIPL